VQYWLVRPPNFDASRKYPVVFLIHGGPQGAWEDAWSTRWNPSLWAAQGWVIAAPNPRGSTGFGQKFVDEISLDWGGQVMADIDAVVNDVARLPFTDSTRMGIAGASYGGYAVNWILGHSNRFKAAVTHDGVFNLESMSMATEELWFTEWEFGGPPWSSRAREQFLQWSPHLRPQHHDADADHHQRAGFPRARRSGPADVHRPAAQRRAGRSAGLPGRGALGARRKQQPRLARVRVRLDV
jgi:dipeptidyl aminopeptidase/acylaminoacyl peptidase